RLVAQKALIGDEAVGIMEKSGRFVLFSMADGKPTIDAQLEPVPDLTEIHLFRGETHDVLVTNKPARQRVQLQMMPAGIGTLVNGFVYGFDRATGTKVYSTAIENKVLAPGQAADVPVLVFATYAQRPGPNAPQGNLLCV